MSRYGCPEEWVALSGTKRKAGPAGMNVDLHPDDMPPQKLSAIDYCVQGTLLQAGGFFQGEQRQELYSGQQGSGMFDADLRYVQGGQGGPGGQFGGGFSGIDFAAGGAPPCPLTGKVMPAAPATSPVSDLEAMCEEEDGELPKSVEKQGYAAVTKKTARRRLFGDTNEGTGTQFATAAGEEFRSRHMGPRNSENSVQKMFQSQSEYNVNFQKFLGEDDDW